MSKSAFQIPQNVAIRIFVYAPPRCKLSQNSGAGGDGLSPRAEKWGNKSWNFATICEEVEACSRFVWANSVNVCFRNSAIVDLGRAKSLSTRGSGHMYLGGELQSRFLLTGAASIRAELAKNVPRGGSAGRVRKIRPGELARSTAPLRGRARVSPAAAKARSLRRRRYALNPVHSRADSRYALIRVFLSS